MLEFINNKVNPYLKRNESDNSIEISETIIELEIKRINTMLDRWDEFSQSLMKISSIGRVSNRSALANPYSIRSEINILNSKDSIVVCLSALGDYYGFYYCSYAKNASVPIKIYVKDFRDFSKTIEQIDHRISYFPFSEAHVATVREIERELHKSFPEFSRFEAMEASSIIENCIISGEKFTKLDLFQLVFIDHPVVL
jgi:hypothetical protein